MQHVTSRPFEGAPITKLAGSDEPISKPQVDKRLPHAGDKELVGTLRGFDVFVNMVLEEVEAFEATEEGTKVTKLEQILLNGNNIAVIVPGGKPE